MKCDKENLLLYAVTDRHWLEGRTLHEVVKESLEGGVTFVQLREKKLDEEHFLKEAKDLKELCREYHVPFVINDNVEIPIEIDADKIIGVSAQTVEQAVLAERHGADYLGVGAVFPTSSKDDAVEVPFETLKAICEAVSIPVIAIGGITKDNVKELSSSGICGIAVISAIYGQKDIKKASEELKTATKEMVRE